MGTSKCPHCGAAMSCSCQLRTASDGTKVCNTCVSQYEEDLKKKQIKRREETT